MLRGKGGFYNCRAAGCNSCGGMGTEETGACA